MFATLLLITHKMHLLELVDRIIVLDNGHLVADGDKGDILKQLKSGMLNVAPKERRQV